MDYGVLTYGGDERFPAEDSSSVQEYGMDAAVCHNILYSSEGILNKLHIGKLTYLLIGVKQLLLRSPPRAICRWMGFRRWSLIMPILFRSLYPSIEGAVSNASYDDGKLSICDEQQKKRKLIPVLLNSMFGRQSHNKGTRFYMRGSCGSRG